MRQRFLPRRHPDIEGTAAGRLGGGLSGNDDDRARSGWAACVYRGGAIVAAIVNPHPDSFYDRGAAVGDGRGEGPGPSGVVDEGADLVDIRRDQRRHRAPEDRRGRGEAAVVDFVAWVRGEYPDLVISVDTWRAEVGRRSAAGADLLNDAWGGADPELPAVAAEFGSALVCTHTGGVTPRTQPFRIEYDDVVAAIVASLVGQAEPWAVALRVERDRIPSTRRTISARTPGTRWRRRDGWGVGRDRMAGAGVVVQQGLRR